jgi:hypothetical protein
MVRITVAGRPVSAPQIRRARGRLARKHRRFAQLATSAACHSAAPSRRPLADLFGLLLCHRGLVRILAVDGLNALQVLVVLGPWTAARLAESACCEAGHSTTI